MKMHTTNKNTGVFYQTVVFLIQNGKVLLARKSAKIGKGCLNGYGGEIEKGEKILTSAARELREESGVIAKMDALRKVGFMKIRKTKRGQVVFLCNLHIFVLTNWEGEPRASKEMKEPTWFDIDSLPLDEMMPADRLWLPRILDGETLKGEITLTKQSGGKMEIFDVINEHDFDQVIVLH